jgi:hypothetical protein
MDSFRLVDFEPVASTTRHSPVAVALNLLLPRAAERKFLAGPSPGAVDVVPLNLRHVHSVLVLVPVLLPYAL